MRQHFRQRGRAVILAGGRSVRMGSDKAGLRLGAETLLERLARGLAQLFSDVGVSVAPGGTLQHRAALVEAAGDEVVFYEDRRPDRGPMEAVRSVLEQIPEAAAFFVAVDVPVVSRSAVDLLLERHESGDAEGEVCAVVPRWRGRVQPTFAVYGKPLLAGLNRALETDHRALRQVADWPGVAVVDLDDAWPGSGGLDLDPFAGINRPEDHESLVKLHESGRLAGPIV